MRTTRWTEGENHAEDTGEETAHAAHLVRPFQALVTVEPEHPSERDEN
ncbi:hypothetical protein AB0D57_09890 [Streptomyces sp. NPDC048275]